MVEPGKWNALGWLLRNKRLPKPFPPSPFVSACLVFIVGALVTWLAIQSVQQSSIAVAQQRLAILRENLPLVGFMLSAGFALIAYFFAKLIQARKHHSHEVIRAKSTEARMRAIIRSSMEAIITMDDQQKIVIFNPMAETIFKCAARDAIGASISQFVPHRFRAQHAQEVQKFGTTSVSERVMAPQRRLYAVRADGAEFPIEASISHITVAGTKLFTVMLRDITDRVAAEDSLRASSAELRALSASLQSAREAEKYRIARELHDDLGQQLTALKMDLASVDRKLDARLGASNAFTQPLHEMMALVSNAFGSLRRIAADLRPVMLDDLGLLPAIDWLSKDFSDRTGIVINKQLETSVIAYRPDAATALFRIVQEALNNVAKHSQATRVDITLMVTGDLLVLTIHDNGRARGDNGDTHHKLDAFGLIGIRERAHIFGGTAHFHTDKALGFKVTVNLPVDAVQLHVPEESHDA